MFITDPGYDFFPSRIPDPNYLHPGSSSKNLSFLTPKNKKKWFISPKKYDPGCSSRIPDPDADFLPIPDPGSRGQKRTQSRIRIRNTVCISTSGYRTLCPSPTSCLVFFWYSRETIPYLWIEVCDTVGAVLVLAQSFPDSL
jgi:hypothetical protein